MYFQCILALRIVIKMTTALDQNHVHKMKKFIVVLHLYLIILDYLTTHIQDISGLHVFVMKGECGGTLSMFEGSFCLFLLCVV